MSLYHELYFLSGLSGFCFLTKVLHIRALDHGDAACVKTMSEMKNFVLKIKTGTVYLILIVSVDLLV